MFTGIIEATGTVVKNLAKGSSVELWVAHENPFEDLRQGSSVSVNGSCLTLLERSQTEGGEILEFEVSGETLQRTNLASLKKGARVNLERSLILSQRLEGHIVLGHVDSTVNVLEIRKESGNGRIFRFGFDSCMAGSFVEKGSASLNGVSLTVFGVTDKSFEAVILPYTFEQTNFKGLKVGDIVNCEADILGKYIQAMASKGKGQSRIDKDFLSRHGFGSKGEYAE